MRVVSCIVTRYNAYLYLAVACCLYNLHTFFQNKDLLTSKV